MNKGASVVPIIIIVVALLAVLFIGWRMFLVREPVPAVEEKPASFPVIDSTHSTSTPDATSTRDMKG